MILKGCSSLNRTTTTALTVCWRRCPFSSSSTVAPWLRRVRRDARPAASSNPTTAMTMTTCPHSRGQALCHYRYHHDQLTFPECSFSTSANSNSSESYAEEEHNNNDNNNNNNNHNHQQYHYNSGPSGSLFAKGSSSVASRSYTQQLIGQEGYIQRTFEAQSNAQALLVGGGAALAAHASFDPLYTRAQGWIRHHAVGPAVLSPVLLNSLTGALVEAAFPHAVLDGQSMQQVRPLIVGVTVLAKIKVVNVQDYRKDHDEEQNETTQEEGAAAARSRSHGYKVDLETSVTQVRDHAVIAHGHYSIWIPDYLNM